jgi:hypothetical protein
VTKTNRTRTWSVIAVLIAEGRAPDRHNHHRDDYEDGRPRESPGQCLSSERHATLVVPVIEV